MECNSFLHKYIYTYDIMIVYFVLHYTKYFVQENNEYCCSLPPCSKLVVRLTPYIGRLLTFFEAVTLQTAVPGVNDLVLLCTRYSSMYTSLLR